MKQLSNNLKELHEYLTHEDNRLKKLHKMLSAAKYTNIQLHFFADNQLQTIYQADSPFNLENELRILIAGMIDQIELDIQNFKNNYNETSNY